MSSTKIQRVHYGSIEGLRAYSAIGIVLMHALGNGPYALNGFLFEQLIPSFTNLVFLFMVISGFSMCCGYYDRMIGNTITAAEFYSKRYAKIWPFFALLCILDLVISPSKNALYEVFANLTLCFGLLPDPDISVIGVGWFLGLVFVFYLVFPFFCYLLSDKKRAWFAFAVTIVFNYLCTVRFITGRRNILYSAMFFFAGGLIFLYKEPLRDLTIKYRWLLITAIAILTGVYYTVSGSAQVMLLLFGCILIYGLRPTAGSGVLCNSFTKFLSGISMEVYLCHMVVFRILEKLGMTNLFESDLVSYIVTCIVMIAGTIAFVLAAIKFLKCFSGCMKLRIGKRERDGMEKKRNMDRQC